MASKTLVSKFLHRLKQKKKIKIQQLKYTVIVFDPKYPMKLGFNLIPLNGIQGLIFDCPNFNNKKNVLKMFFEGPDMKILL
jgi:hypothetical protein